MIVVIIAGGSGSRLWPLSTPEYPKHLLVVGDDHLSLLQRTYRRAKKLSKDVYIVTELSHSHHVKQQLNEVPEDNFIIEPARRGTANCIVAALAHIENRHKKGEIVSFLQADHFIRDQEGFVNSFNLAANTVMAEDKLVLIGTEPDYPSVGFGYIKKKQQILGSQFIYTVDGFKEKPDFELAKIYLKSGTYLWNCGYFVASIEIFIREIKGNSPSLYENYTKLKNASPEHRSKLYMSFETLVIEYAVIEKVKDLLVVHASFDWMDLGTFNDLSKIFEVDKQGNQLRSKTIEIEEVENSFVYNEEDKPVVVVGLDNIVVVNNKNGIFVGRKDLSQKVGEISKRFSK